MFFPETDALNATVRSAADAAPVTVATATARPCPTEAACFARGPVLVFVDSIEPSPHPMANPATSANAKYLRMLSSFVRMIPTPTLDIHKKEKWRKECVTEVWRKV